MSDKIYMRLGKELGIGGERVARAAALLDEGNTVPFIARYRKEMTGGLTDEELRLLQDRLGHYRNLEQRREEVLRLIEALGALSPEISEQVEGAATVTELDDIYRPFRPKKKTRASQARGRGLEPLALALLGEDVDPAGEALRYLDAEQELPDEAAVLGGAADIIAEMVSDHAGVRGKLRDLYRHSAVVEVLKKKGAEDETYDQYAGYS